MRATLVTRIILVTSLAAAAAGCAFGATAGTFRPAQGPAGVQAHVATDTAEFHGELIEVRTSGLVLLSQSSRGTGRRSRPAPEVVLRLLPFTSVRSARFEQMGEGVMISGNQAPASAVLNRLKLVSRFPQGMSESTLAQLLSNCGQPALAGIEP